MQPEEMDIYQTRNLISEIRELTELSSGVKDATISYVSMMLDLGFNRSWKIGSTDGFIGQELILCTSSSAAEEMMIELQQPTIELLTATFGETWGKVDAKLIDIDKSGLSSDSWGVYLNMKLDEGRMFLHQISVREANLISIITVGSAAGYITPYSAETADDALLLSQKSMSRIREQVASQ